MADTIVKGYPLSIGGKIYSVVDHTGPASYTQVTTGATPSGGDVIQAAAFGMKYIESIEIDGDSTAVYDIVPASPPDALPRTSWILRWFTAAGRGEVAGATNLSASHVRICVTGI